MFNLATTPLFNDESRAPRFCANCGTVISPEPFRHESDFCNVCISRMPPYNPFAMANDGINGDAGQILLLTPSGEFPHELHGNTFREPGSNYVPLAPSVRGSGHPHVPPSFYVQQPQPISHIQSSDSDRMRSSYTTYRPDVLAGTSQRASDRNAYSITGYSATSRPHQITSQDRQPKLQVHPLNCEKCRIFMSNQLVGDGRVCSRCLFQHRSRKPTMSAKPSRPFSKSHSFKHRDVIDLTGDDGLGHALITDTASPVKTKTAPPNRIEIPLPQQSSSDPSPSKRRRIDEVVRNASTEPYKNANQLAIQAEGNVSNICSTLSCDQAIPVESCGTRCISCVKLHWNSIKDQFKPSRPHHGRGERNALPSALAKSTKAKSRKSVTWSDMVTVTSGDGTITKCLAGDVEKDNLSGDNEQDVNTLTAARIVDNIDDGVHGMDVVSPTDTSLELEPRTAETQEGPLVPLEQPIASITGWDSDLSELSESDESDSTDDSGLPLRSLTIGQAPQISAPTGLKIRIPARSSTFCSRKCRNPMCNQVLAANYLGKTCMICRVRHRIQRRQGLHDEEDIPMLDSEPPKFVPNARLCAASECTHFIPPQQEYKFKRCNLCRLYQEERRLLRQREADHQSDSTKPIVDVKGIYNSFRFLPVRLPTPGRCPSLDCGLLHESGSASCRQCISRRAKLMKKAGIQEEHRGVKQDKAPRELNIYPQYICHSFLVSAFEGRLKAFLKSQTLFFLFRVHHPSLVGTKALFSFDGEYSVVAHDFDVVGRRTEIDVRALKTKRVLEGIEGLKFTPKRLISVLEGGGVATRFLCTYQASVLQPMMDKNVVTVTEAMRPMTGELEIAVFPDHSHRCLPGEKTIIRFRLLG